MHRERKTEADFTAMKPERQTDTEIYTVEELAHLLTTGDADSVPFIAIGAFAGIRSYEMRRLDWAAFRWDQGVIEIKGGKAKTGSRRNAPLLPVLAGWLEPYKKTEGPVFRCQKAEMVARGPGAQGRPQVEQKRPPPFLRQLPPRRAEGRLPGRL